MPRNGFEGHVRRTPLLRTDISPGLMIKPESLQVTGSFKARGAFNAVLSLLEREPRCCRRRHAQLRQPRAGARLRSEERGTARDGRRSRGRHAGEGRGHPLVRCDRRLRRRQLRQPRNHRRGDRADAATPAHPSIRRLGCRAWRRDGRPRDPRGHARPPGAVVVPIGGGGQISGHRPCAVGALAGNGDHRRRAGGRRRCGRQPALRRAAIARVRSRHDRRRGEVQVDRRPELRGDRRRRTRARDRHRLRERARRCGACGLDAS